MAAVYSTIDLAELAEIPELFQPLARLETKPLLEAVGGIVESQTRRRLSEEKQGPGGEAWAAWSKDYAKSRHSNHSLLEGLGDLVRSLNWFIEGDDLLVGSPLVYADAHQSGYEQNNLPARPFLGLSGENQTEIVDIMLDYLGQRGGRAQPRTRT